MNNNYVASIASVDHRKQRGIAHESTVPIMLAVDLGRAHRERYACRSEYGIGGNFGVGEDFHFTGPHGCRRQEQLDRPLLAYTFEVDDPIEQVLHWIYVEGIELIGRHEPTDEIDEHIAWRVFETEFWIHLVEIGRCNNAA